MIYCIRYWYKTGNHPNNSYSTCGFDKHFLSTFISSLKKEINPILISSGCFVWDHVSMLDCPNQFRNDSQIIFKLWLKIHMWQSFFLFSWTMLFYRFYKSPLFFHNQECIFYVCEDQTTYSIQQVFLLIEWVSPISICVSVTASSA